MGRVEALTTGQLLDRIFTFYTKNFVLFFTIAIIPHLIYMAVLLVPTFLSSSHAIGTTSRAVVAGVAVLVGIIAQLLALGVSQGASTVGVSDIYLGQPTSVGKCYRKMFPMTFRLAGLALGYGMLVGLGFILLIVPGVYWAITYALATAVMAIERVSFSEAMSRSSDLVKGFRGRVALIFLLSLVLSWVVAFGLAFPATLLAASVMKNSPILAQVINLSVSTLAGGLSSPIGLIGFTLAYYDARVRKEAFDLEYMMQSDVAVQSALTDSNTSSAAGA